MHRTPSSPLRPHEPSYDALLIAHVKALSRPTTPSPAKATPPRPVSLDLPPNSPLSSLHDLHISPPSTKTPSPPPPSSRFSASSTSSAPLSSPPTTPPRVHNPLPRLSTRTFRPTPALAGIAARGRIIDNFPLDRPVVAARASRPPSANSLDIPRGKLQSVPARAATPSRLPRPRVFIAPSASRPHTTDAVAVDTEMQFVTRQVPTSGSAERAMKPSGSVPLLDCVTVLQDDEFYFSDEEPESVQNRKPGVNYDPELRDGVNNEALSNKVRRAVSALRSISFQMNTTEDLDTAWGQAHVLENARKKGTGGMMCGSVGSKWRRPRARGLSKGSVVEYGMSDCFSDSDVLSAASYNSTTSCKDRGFGGARRDALRCVPPSRVRNTLQGQYKKSLWSGGRRDRQPQARAAQILVSNGGRGFLAASNPDSALTVVPGEVLERTGECRRSVDKYVEFIHASAQRETRIHQKNMKRRFIGKMFRKRRN